MHKIYSIIVAFFSLLCLYAQDTQPEEFRYHLPKSSTLSIGVGMPSTTQLAAEFIGILDQEAKATLQLTLRYEYAINENIGIGAYVGYYSGETESISLPSIQLDSILNDPGSIIDNLLGSTSTSSTYHIGVLTIGGHLSYHLYRFKDLDTYTIIKGGYNKISIREDGAKNNDFLGANVPQFEYFAGAGLRYYFSPTLACYGEVGNSILSPLHINLGGTFRF